MRKFSNWVIDVVAILVFILGTILSALDLFGVTNIAKYLWPESDINSQMINIIVLMVSTMGATLIFERRLLLTGLEKNISNILENVIGTDRNHQELIEMLIEISKNSIPARLYEKRADHYLAFADALKRAPTGSHIYVTHFEKYRGASFDVGEVEAEKQFMEQWIARVKNGDLHVRHIVHVSSTFDLEEVESRIKIFGTSPNYLLNVMYGPPIKPYIDLIVIRGQWAMFDFSNNPISPFEDAVAIAFNTTSIVDALERYFEIWWSRFSLPVKDRDGVKIDALLELKDMLPASAAESWLDQSLELSLRLAKDRFLYDQFINISKEYTNLDKVPGSEIFKESATKLICEYVDKLRYLSKNTIELDSIQSTLVLANIYEQAVGKVDAVSYEIRQERFWISSLGRRILRANADAIKRGVKITRIFVISTSQLELSTLKTILTEHLQAGVNVMVAEANDLPTELIDDYLIQDNRLIFKMEVTEQGGMVSKSFLTIDDAKVKSSQELFEMLHYRSQSAVSFLKTQN